MFEGDVPTAAIHLRNVLAGRNVTDPEMRAIIDDLSRVVYGEPRALVGAERTATAVHSAWQLVRLPEAT